MDSANSSPGYREEVQIRTVEVRSCPLCEASGVVLYEDLTDKSFAAPGRWNMRRCSNHKCGLIWLDPIPHEEDLYKVYVQYYTHEDFHAQRPRKTRDFARWIKQGYYGVRFGYNAESLPLLQKCVGSLVLLNPRLSRRLNLGVKYLRAESCRTILDVGCGAGEWARSMKDLGAEANGVDFDPKAVQMAEKNGVRARLGSVEQANYDDERFDLVNMNHVIEHVPNPVKTLLECARILKPGGFVAIATPNSKSLAHKIFGRSWRGLEPPRHLHLMQPDTLAQIVEKAGLKVVMNRSHRGTSATFRESYRVAKGRPIGDSSRSKTLAEVIAVNAFAALEATMSVFSRSRGQHIFLLAQKVAS